MKKRIFRLLILAVLLVLLLAAAQEDEPETFVPSEEVSADRGVAFPVDI